MKNSLFITLIVTILIISGSVAYYFVIYLPGQEQAYEGPPLGPALNGVEEALNKQQPSQPEQQANPPNQTRMYPKNVGDKFIVNGIEFNIVSSKNLGSDLSTYDRSYQTTSGKYVEVKMAAKNTGTNDAGIAGILFFIEDSEKRQYVARDNLDFLFLSVPGYEIINTSNESYGFAYYDKNIIKPGFTENYVYITEIASESTGLRMIVANQADQNYYIPLDP